MSLVIELLIIVLILYLVLMSREINDPFLKKVCWVSLGVRIGLSLMLYFISFQQGNHGYWKFAQDAHLYNQQGSLVADTIAIGQIPLVQAMTIYPYMVGILYFLFGKNLLSAVFFNNLVGVFVVIMGYKTAKLVYSEEIARICALLLAFFPSHILFSAQALKDSLVGLFFFLALYQGIKIIRGEHRLWLYFLNIVTLLIFALLRMYTAVFLGVAFLAGLLCGLAGTRKYKIMAASIGYLAFAFVIASAFMGFFGTQEFMGVRLDLAGVTGASSNLMTGIILKLSQLRTTFYAVGNAAIDKSVYFYSIGDILLYLPRGLTNVFLQPFPWNWFIGSGIIQKLNAPEMIVWYCLLAAAVPGIYKSWKTNRAVTLVFSVFVMLLSVTYAVVAANIGAIYRLRMLIQFVIFMFASVQLAETGLVKRYLGSKDREDRQEKDQFELLQGQKDI